MRALLKSSGARSESQRFVVEGVRLAEEAVAADWPIISGLYTEKLSERGQALLEKLEQSNIEMELCTPELWKSTSDTQNPQGLALIIGQKKLELPSKAEFFLILDAVQDPGNMGSLLRSALGAGVEAVLLGPKCVDAYSPKVLRSAMGAQFRLPLKKMSWDEIGKLISDQGLKVYASEMNEGINYSKANFVGPTTLILGNEAAGIGSEARNLAGESIHIPMSEHLESLNAAAAGAILLFEIAGQKSMKVKQ